MTEQTDDVTVDFMYAVPLSALADPVALTTLERKAVMDMRAAYRGHRLSDFQVSRAHRAVAVYETEDDIVPTRYAPVEDADAADTEVRILTAIVGAAPAGNTVDLTEDQEAEAMRRLGIAARDRGDFERDDWLSEALDIIEQGHLGALLPEHAAILADEVKRLRAERAELGIQAGLPGHGIPE